jgi:hypothetical protein
MEAINLSDADIAYVHANFRPLPELCRERGARLEELQALIGDRRLPAPSYVLPDGNEMVPADYFVLVDEAGGPERLRPEFERRHGAAGGAAAELADDWEGYIDGIYGICLRTVTPETIVRKSQLVESLGARLERPAPEDPEWRTQLQREVDELDALERDFSPDYDRRRFDRPPSRDLLIKAARERYPQLFTAKMAR